MNCPIKHDTNPFTELWNTFMTLNRHETILNRSQAISMQSTYESHKYHFEEEDNSTIHRILEPVGGFVLYINSSYAICYDSRFLFENSFKIPKG